MPPVVVVGGAGAFARDHQRAERRLGSALIRERGALGRLAGAFEHFTRDTHGRLLDADFNDIEEALRVEVGELLAEAKAARGDGPDAAPPAVGDLEYPGEHATRGGIAIDRDRAGVAVLDFGP